MIVLFSILTAGYFLFLLWLKWGLTQEKYSPKKENKPPPKIAIIVAARNEQENITNLLRHLQTQSYPHNRYEIIIVNDNSTDATGDIIKEFEEKDSRIQGIHLKDIPEGWSPKKWALTQGVQASSGDILLFTDADCTPGDDWIMSMVSCFNHENIGIVGGPSPLLQNHSLWNRMLLMDSIGQDALSAGGLSRNFPLTVSGRNLAIRRTAFDKVKGYKGVEDFFSGDDDLLMHKVANKGWKLRACLLTDAEVISSPPSSLITFIQQRLRFASKGKSYFTLPFVHRSFKWILLLIYITNLCVLSGQIFTLTTLRPDWLLPWLIKIVGDGLLIRKYTTLLSRSFDFFAFLLSEVWHSLYVVVLGTLGSFLPISWKGRQKHVKIT